MAEYCVEEAGLSFAIDTKYYNQLDIEGFSHMMKDPSYYYKFYWHEAIVQLISEGVTETTFDTVIDEMICNAWFSDTRGRNDYPFYSLSWYIFCADSYVWKG